MAKALEAVKGFFKRLPLKAPWEVRPLHISFRPHTLPVAWPDMPWLAAGDRCCLQLGVQITSGSAWDMAQACPRVSSLQH